MKKRSSLAALILTLMVAVSGCGQAIYDHNQLGSLKFESLEFVNPTDCDDIYGAIEYEERIYVPYGTLKGRVQEQDIKECLGYVIQNETNSSAPDPENTDFRVYTLTDDPDCNFLMEKYVGESVMDQPYFYRALDTLGQNVKTPKFIEDLGYDVWDGQIVKVYDITNMEHYDEYSQKDEYVTVVRYYEMKDKTWRTDENLYKYRLEITGRMGGAAKDSTFVYLSNLEEISFDQAWKAAGFSSDMADYFDVKDAILVAKK